MPKGWRCSPAAATARSLGGSWPAIGPVPAQRCAGMRSTCRISPGWAVASSRSSSTTWARMTTCSSRRPRPRPWSWGCRPSSRATPTTRSQRIGSSRTCWWPSGTVGPWSRPGICDGITASTTWPHARSWRLARPGPPMPARDGPGGRGWTRPSTLPRAAIRRCARNAATSRPSRCRRAGPRTSSWPSCAGRGSGPATPWTTRSSARRWASASPTSWTSSAGPISRASSWSARTSCASRGSGASRRRGGGAPVISIVAYALGITRVDPIRHDLLFERFINEGRVAYPDIDIDFASSRREEVIQYVYQTYGVEHTGMVANLVTYRARSAVREVGTALGFPAPLVDRVAKALETYDSVMVRRDLEADGGFAELFRQPGGVPAGPAAGAALVERRGFVDGMGQLDHRRTRPMNSPTPRSSARTGRSDDEGGPGDTPVSEAWIRRESVPGRADRPMSPLHPVDTESGMLLTEPRTIDSTRGAGRRSDGGPGRPARQTRCSPDLRAGAAADAPWWQHRGPVALGALAGAVRPARWLPPASLDPCRRHARDPRAARLHRAPGAGHDARSGRHPVGQAGRGIAGSREARPAGSPDAVLHRRGDPAGGSRTAASGSTSMRCPRTCRRSTG